MVGVVVSMRRLVADQFHEVIGSFAFDFEHHFPFQRPQPVMHEKKRNENRGNPDRHKPFIADVTARMKDESFRRKLVVQLLNQWLEGRPLKSQPELGDADLEQLLVA